MTDWYKLNEYEVYWDAYGTSTPQDELDGLELGERVVDWMLDETTVRVYSSDPGQFHFILHLLRMIRAYAPRPPAMVSWEAEIREIAKRLDGET